MKSNNRILILVSILPVFLITGCVSKRTMPEKGKIQYYRSPALSDEILDKRIDDIRKLVEENSLSDDRKETAVSVLKAYDRLKSMNKENLTEKEYRKTVRLLFNTLLIIEKRYFYDGIISTDTAEEVIFENYSDFKKKIYEDYYAGDLEGVISGCDGLISRFGKSALTPDLGIILAEALSKTDMTTEALTVSKSILGAVENRPGLIRLLASTVELELKAGNVEDAEFLYEKLVDNINERNNLYQKTGNMLSGYQDHGSIAKESIKDKISGIDPEKSLQMKQLVDVVENLISKNDFSGARLELVKRRLRAEEGPELDLIEQLLKSVDKAEEQFASENSNDRLILEDARKLIEKEKYEEALDILEPLVGAGNNYEAEKIKKEAVEKLINREKLTAANYKLEANKERDVQRKRELLLKAKTIFQDLIDKYPASPSIDRIKRNIAVLDEELMQLPPLRSE